MTQEEFEALVRAHADGLRRFVVRRTAPGWGVDPDDVVAEVFATAWRRREEFSQPHRVGWLYRTAHFCLAAAVRRARRGESYSQLDDRDVAPDPAVIVTENDALAEAWRSLSDLDREVLRLSAWEGLSGSDLACALQMSPSAAYSALSRARHRMAAMLEPPEQ